MERDYKKELANFEAVWRRVSGEKTPAAKSAKLYPRKEGKKRNTRFGAPR